MAFKVLVQDQSPAFVYFGMKNCIIVNVFGFGAGLMFAFTSEEFPGDSVVFNRSMTFGLGVFAEWSSRRCGCGCGCGCGR
eukprot:scaffold1663_cov171-Amphora_coffeaeformis.AAC.17